MQKLIKGIHQFQNEVFSNETKLFERLAKGQNPLALFITCSDSRIDPAMLTQTRPGELFILRNAGNIVPPYGAVHGGESATIEYAVSVLKVKDIIVCGHSLCGAMQGLLQPETLENVPAVRNWLNHAEATARIMKENYMHITDPQDRLTATVEENVLVQLENLRTHPSVRAAMGRGELNLSGWVYKFQTGKVFAFDPIESQYTLLSQPKPAMREVTETMPAI